MATVTVTNAERDSIGAILAISGSFGFFLLRSVAISHVNPYLDLAITGLTIGAGTKPTHDLITSMQAKAVKPS